MTDDIAPVVATTQPFPAPAVATTEPLPPEPMVIVHTAYFDAAGKLLLIVSGGVMEPPSNAVSWMEVADPNNFNIYFDGAVKNKQAFNLIVERNKVSGIPPGTTVYMSDSTEVVDDGVIEFDVDYEGVVDMFFDHHQFVSQVVSVEVGP